MKFLNKRSGLEKDSTQLTQRDNIVGSKILVVSDFFKNTVQLLRVLKTYIKNNQYWDSDNVALEEINYDRFNTFFTNTLEEPGEEMKNLFIK